MRKIRFRLKNQLFLAFWNLNFCYLEFICYLPFGIWDLSTVLNAQNGGCKKRPNAIV